MEYNFQVKCNQKNCIFVDCVKDHYIMDKFVN